VIWALGEIGNRVRQGQRSCDIKPTDMKRTTEYPVHTVNFQLVFFELNIYTLSPRNIKRPTLSCRLDTRIIRTPQAFSDAV